jgi:hypothetical protein
MCLAGCQEPTSAPGSGADDHGHEHGEEGHAHHHHGPHGGHLGVVGMEEYHLEWTHDGGKVTFYILDAEGAKEVPIEAEKLTIEVKVGENPPVIYELAAVDPQGEPAKSAAFEIEDVELEGVLDALKPGDEGVTATIKDLKIGDKSFGDVKVEEHEHDHAHGEEHSHGEEHADGKDHGDHKH